MIWSSTAEHPQAQEGRKVDLVILPTAETIGVLTESTKDTNAVLHMTCSARRRTTAMSPDGEWSADLNPGTAMILPLG